MITTAANTHEPGNEPLNHAMAAAVLLINRYTKEAMSNAGLRTESRPDGMQVVFRGHVVAPTSIRDGHSEVLAAVVSAARDRGRVMLKHAQRDIGSCIELPPGHRLYVDVEDQVRHISGTGHCPYLSVLVVPDAAPRRLRLHVDFRISTVSPHARIFVCGVAAQPGEKPPHVMGTPMVAAGTYAELFGLLAKAFNEFVERNQIIVRAGNHTHH